MSIESAVLAEIREKHPFVIPDGRRFSNLPAAAASLKDSRIGDYVRYGDRRIGIQDCLSVLSAGTAAQRDAAAREVIARESGVIL